MNNINNYYVMQFFINTKYLVLYDKLCGQVHVHLAEENWRWEH